MLKVEDGSIIEDANSYIALEDADKYCLVRGLWAETPGLENADGEMIFDAEMTRKKETALIRAFDWLNSLNWKGKPEFAFQLQAWPRTDILIYNDFLPNGCIPQAIKFGQCEMAALIFAGFNPFEPLERGGTYLSKSESKSQGVDVLSNSESRNLNYGDNAPVETLYPSVISWLRPYLAIVPGEIAKNSVHEAGRG